MVTNNIPPKNDFAEGRLAHMQRVLEDAGIEGAEKEGLLGLTALMPDTATALIYDISTETGMAYCHCVSYDSFRDRASIDYYSPERERTSFRVFRSEAELKEFLEDSPQPKESSFPSKANTCIMVSNYSESGVHELETPIVRHNLEEGLIKIISAELPDKLLVPEGEGIAVMFIYVSGNFDKLTDGDIDVSIQPA